MNATVVEITDPDDPRIAVYRDVRDKDLRGRDQLFMAESEMVIRRLLQSPQRLHSLLLSPRVYANLQDSLHALPQDRPVYLADIDLMCRISGFHIHRGALAAGYRPSAEELSIQRLLDDLPGRGPLTLLLARGLTNIDNMGGLYRDAAAFGVDAIVLDSTCCDPLYRKAIRVSMGHVLSIRWAVSTNDWLADVEQIRDAGDIRIVAAESGVGARPLWEMVRHDRVAYMFGSEANGLDEPSLQICDERVEIPMSGSVPSLNVATAAAVVLYEHQRCRA